MPIEKINGKFFTIPNSIFDKNLKPRDFIVYCCLVMYSDRKGYCYPSRKRIAEKCCIDHKTVDAAIAVLVESGLIEKTSRTIDGRKTSNGYKLTKSDE